MYPVLRVYLIEDEKEDLFFSLEDRESYYCVVSEQMDGMIAFDIDKDSLIALTEEALEKYCELKNKDCYLFYDCNESPKYLH